MAEPISEGLAFFDTEYLDSWKSPSHAARKVTASRSNIEKPRTPSHEPPVFPKGDEPLVSLCVHRLCGVGVHRVHDTVV